MSKRPAPVRSNGSTRRPAAAPTDTGKAAQLGALEYVDVPGYSSLLLRRTFSELALPGSLMDRSKRWLTGSGAHWNEQLKRWAFPSGATLAFGYLETDADTYRYQSAEFQMIGFDELTEFTEAQYGHGVAALRYGIMGARDATPAEDDDPLDPRRVLLRQHEARVDQAAASGRRWEFV